MAAAIGAFLVQVPWAWAATEDATQITVAVSIASFMVSSRFLNAFQSLGVMPAKAGIQ
jgi:hypothetical protein